MPGSQAPELKLDNQICFAIHATAHAFAQAYRPHLKALKLTYPQYLVLLVLWEGDGLSVKAIGRRLFLDSGTLTPLLKRLEGLGYVKRSRDPQDERVVLIHLTEVGCECKTLARTIPRTMLAACASDVEALTELNVQVRALGTILRQKTKPCAGVLKREAKPVR